MLHVNFFLRLFFEFFTFVEIFSTNVYCIRILILMFKKEVVKNKALGYNLELNLYQVHLDQLPTLYQMVTSFKKTFNTKFRRLDKEYSIKSFPY